MGTAFVHTLLADHSRVAHAEIHDHETADTAVAVLRHAVRRSVGGRVTVSRVHDPTVSQDSYPATAPMFVGEDAPA